MSTPTFSAAVLAAAGLLAAAPALGADEVDSGSAQAGVNGAPAALPAAPAPDPDPSYLLELVARARALGLARERAWLKLGHYRKGLFGGQESQADGPAFFLAEKGKGDPAAELEATLAAFFAPAPADPEKEEHPQCRFPARFAWLAVRLGIDSSRLPPRPCPKLEAFWRRTSAHGVTLVFSSYYLNNPASAFGHTFLRLDKWAGEGERRELVDQGVDYAAEADTGNAILYALKGFTGLFQGKFTARPYFYKVREYVDYESRDLWEYELSLKPPQVAMLVAHLWELGHTWFDYYYLTENCSYHILGALEAAAPELELLEELGPITLPADAVKALFATPGLVRSVRYRPSVLSQVEGRTAGMSSAELDRVEALASGEAPALPPPDLERARILDAAVDLVDFRHGRAIVHGNDPGKVQLRQALLEDRAAIPVTSEPLTVSPPAFGGPELGHGSARIAVGGGADTSVGPLILLEGRLALHDLLDPPEGFTPRTQLVFLDVRLRSEPRGHALRLDQGWLANIVSLNPLDRFSKSIAWKVRAGAETVRDRGCARCLAASTELGGGPAWMTAGGTLTAFLSADVEVLAGPGLAGAGGAWVRPGVGPGALVRLMLGARAALAATARWRWLPAADPVSTFALGAEGRLHLGPVDLALSADRRPGYGEALARVLWFR